MRSIIWPVLHRPFYQYNPIKTIKTSVMGAINMLGLAKRVKARVFLKASTSEVYEDPVVHPQPEGYWGNVKPIGPGHVMMRVNVVQKLCL